MKTLYHTDNSDGSGHVQPPRSSGINESIFLRLIKQHYPRFYTASFQQCKRALWKKSMSPITNLKVAVLNNFHQSDDIGLLAPSFFAFCSYKFQ